MGTVLSACHGQCAVSISRTVVDGQCAVSVSRTVVDGQCAVSVSRTVVDGQCAVSVSRTVVDGQWLCPPRSVNIISGPLLLLLPTSVWSGVACSAPTGLVWSVKCQQRPHYAL